MEQIFLNYRKDGGSYAAALLDELLSKRFGESRVFRAARSIPPGSDYPDAILGAAARCEILLAVVDPGWRNHFSTGPGATDPEENWVTREMAEAFENDRTVIPVLLSNTPRLDATALPHTPTLTRLARLQYLRFDYRHIHRDTAAMTDQLTRMCPRLIPLDTPAPAEA
ncbi:toll/interleukin-1 receptor domain-containing protein [Streptomyces sp. NPDC006798]|uniref:toll/interleukin-1 receptor domain-containing protein n=1 Tax=Streptomyces sp. NPDC006798 TaxID=3155462 RepID=UPI0033F6723F